MPVCHLYYRFINQSNIPVAARNLSPQLLRSSSSVGANIIEGSSSSPRKELAKYYQKAPRSANDSSYWLKPMNEGYEMKKDGIDELSKEADELVKNLSVSIIKLRTPQK